MLVYLLIGIGYLAIICALGRLLGGPRVQCDCDDCYFKARGLEVGAASQANHVERTLKRGRI